MDKSVDTFLNSGAGEPELGIPNMPTKVSASPAASDENSTPGSQRAEAQVLAYMGVVGGAGTTSLAVQTAHELAASDNQVLLADLDFERGTIAAYLDSLPSGTLSDINESAGRMDPDLAGTFIQPYGDGLFYFSAAGVLGGNDTANPAAILAMLDSLLCHFDFIILDVPTMWRRTTQAVLGASDQIMLVTPLEVPALHRCRDLRDKLPEMLGRSALPEIIVNKFDRRALRNGVTLKDAQKLLGIKKIETICVDDETVRLSLNCGKPAGRAKPDSRYVKSVRSHVGARLGAEPQEEIQARPIRAFGRRKQEIKRGERRKTNGLAARLRSA